MAQDTTPALVLYVGNGTQTEFEVPFDKGSFGEIKVAFVRRGLTDYTYDPDTYNVKGYLYAWNGGVYTKTETPDTDTPLYDKDGEATGDMWEATMYREPKNDIFTKAYIEWTGDILTSDDVICIVRETTKDQPYSYPNNQKHIERALDNLSRQIQELQLTADNALKVDPSWNYTLDDEHKMDPIAWLQTIVRSKGLTLRELRIDNDYIEYTTDDPDSLTKAWNVLAGVKTGNGGVVSHIRETKVLAEDGVTYIPYLEYSVDGGNSWTPAGRGQSELEHLYVKKSGDTMTGPLKFISTNSRGAIYGEQSGVKVGLVEPDGETITTVGAWTSFGVVPANNIQKLGAPNYKWDTVFAAKLNNGNDLSVPAKSGTLATKDEVDLAANSGDQLTNKGVWYAKMYAATVAPAAEDGTNYADFSQVDTGNNPIIVLYERQNGAWVETDIIAPPADYNGYVTVTSKMWDIVEQDGQQGGVVLWSHNQKTFTPYPKIVSFEDAHLTGNSTTQMPVQPTPQTIVNVDYLSTHSGGTGKDVGDIFFTTRTDNGLAGAVECNGATYNTTDFVGSGNIGGLLADGKVPYVSLADYTTTLATNGVCGVYGWDGAGTTAFRVPSLTDIFVETGTAAQIGDYLPAGAPNLKGTFTCSAAPYSSGVTASGVFTASTGGASLDSGSGGQNGTVTLDASRASGVYKDDATTIQPNTVRYRAMVQLATGATDEALETCTQVLADVAELKYDYVVAFQAPTAANNYTWYRKYKSGWVEQGGKKLTTSNQNTWVTNTVALVIEMADTDYQVMLSNCNLTNGTYGSGTHIPTKTTTSFDISQFNINGGSGSEIAWEVKGMAA